MQPTGLFRSAMAATKSCVRIRSASFASYGYQARLQPTYAQQAWRKQAAAAAKAKKARKAKAEKTKKENKAALRQFRNPNKPKMPAVGWFKFVQQKYAAIPAGQPKPLPKEFYPQLSVEWKAMSAEQKAAYNDDAAMQAYRQQMADYRAHGGDKAWLATAKRMKAERPTASGYFLFAKEWHATHVNANKGIPMGTRTKNMAADWKALSAEDQAAYKERAQQGFKLWKQSVESVLGA